MRNCLAVVVLCALAACSARTASGPVGDTCTKLMPASQLNYLGHAVSPFLYPANPEEQSLTVQDNSYTWGELSADCIITTARRYADRRDDAREVAAAVLDACRNHLSALEARVRDESCSMKVDLLTCIANGRRPAEDVLDEADKAEADIKAAEQQAALRYVIEARSGNCTLDRNRGMGPTGFPIISR